MMAQILRCLLQARIVHRRCFKEGTSRCERGVRKAVVFLIVNVLMVALFAIGYLTNFTLGGMIWLLPAAVVIGSLVRRIGKAPNTEFGRWRARPPVRGERH